MAVKVGNSWVSEAAYAYAQEKAAERSSGEASSGNMLNQLSEKFSDLKFSTNTEPFSSNGKNNMAIAPNILKEMEDDPEKYLEYEALIYDCNNTQKSVANREGLISFGFIINSDGSLGSWSVSKANSGNYRNQFKLDKKDKNNWTEQILEKSKLKKAEQKKIEKKKTEQKKAEQAEEKKAQKAEIEKKKAEEGQEAEMDLTGQKGLKAKGRAVDVKV